MTDKARFSTSTTLVLARAAVDREAKKARRALWVERLLARLWPLWALLALFSGLALLGVPSLLPPEAHWALLIGFAAGGLFLLVRGVAGFRRPTAPEGLARLDEGQAGRPASTWSDDLAAGAGDTATEAIWAIHRRRLAERAAALRARGPDLRVSAQDPFALRHAGLVALAAGALAWFAAEDGAAPRLADQLSPGAVAAPVVALAPTVEAWATPPAYTGTSPIYLTRLAPGSEVSLPVGSEISIRVFDFAAPPVLDEAASGAASSFADKGAGVFDAAFEVRGDGAIRVLDGDDERALWRIAAIPDTAPEIAFDGEPTGGERGALTLPFHASDDYGVVAAHGLVSLDIEAAAEAAGVAAGASVYQPIELDLPLPLAGDLRAVHETLIEDLTAHPWAGLPVVYRLTAVDGAEQEGQAEMRAVLPARRFFHPVAKALVEQRRALAFSTAAAPRVLDVLEAVMIFPEEVIDDPAAYLLARMAVRRLGYAVEDGRVSEETEGVVDLLWRAALRLEDGGLANAAERLARAQERLKDAIENGASEEELARLMQELREAMRDYLAEMMQEALRDQANGQQQQQQQGQQGQDGTQLSMQDLEEMLRELEEAIRNGQQELARQMLQALQQMMQNLQMAQPGQGQPGQGEQMMNQLGDMIGEQQGLADRNFGQMREGRPGEGQGEGEGAHRNEGRGEGQGGDRPGQPGQNGQTGNDSGEQIARDQEALRQLLDQLRQGLPGAAGEDARRSLDDAGRAMDEAAEALRRGENRQALDDQVRALDSLRDGRRALGQDLAEAEGRGQGDRAGRDGPGVDALQEDPLGRPRASDGPLDGDSVEVPNATMGKRARELQEEIRRRAGERDRPAEELDYLDRLLDRF